MQQQKTVLRHLRRSREISIHALARETKINVSTLSLGERGLLTFTDEQQQILATYFNIPKDELLAPYVEHVA